jgi:hypothetical protein
MQRFLKYRKDNRSSGFVGDLDALNTLVTTIEDRGIICLHGPVGVGKSHLVRVALKNHYCVEISRMNDIGEQMHESYAHIMVDSYVVDKSILDYGKKLSRGATILITNHPEKVNFCPILEVKPLTHAQMVHVGLKECKDASHLQALALDARGDMRAFLTTIQFPGTRDLFQSSRDWLNSMMCQGGTRDPMSEFGVQHPDHGFVADIVFSNIHMAVRDIKPEIYDLMSEGDVYDSDNTWELINYYWISSVYNPLKLADRRIPECAMKSGTAWTKFSNQKMREKKLKGLPERATLMLLHQMNDPKRFQTYGISVQQYDTINNIALVKNTKSKKTREALKALDPHPTAWRYHEPSECPLPSSTDPQM